MKKLNYLLSLLVVFGMAFTFTSCDDEETDPVLPTLTFAGGDYIDADATVVAGEELAFSWTSQKGDAKLETFTIKVGNNWAVDNANYEWNGAEDPANWDNETFVGTATFTAGQAGDEMVFTFTVTDKDGEMASKVITVTVEASAGPITSYSAKLMGAQNHATLGSFLDLETGDTYFVSTAANNQAVVDVIYYYGATNAAALAAPDDAGANEFSVFGLGAWTTKNSTKFATTSISAADFTAMTDDGAFVDASETSATQLAAGDVIAFKTVGGKMGLIHVASIDGTDAGSITIDVKIQE